MSTVITWRYVINTFEVNTRGSQVKMLSLSTDTHAKLKAEESDPAIAAILLIYEPVFFAYRDIDQQYGLKAGDYKGNTVGFEEYLDQMPLKLRQWESLIRAVYIEDSPEEKQIFPNKRTPFLDGTYESRLDALGTLKLKTAADPALAAANAQITSFYNAALGARLVQQTSEGALGQLSDLREEQRQILAGELAGVFGQLVFIFRHDTGQVERFFDLSLLKDTGSGGTEVEGSVPFPGFSTIPTTGISINAGTRIKLENTGNSTNRYYYSNAEFTPPGPGSPFTDVQPGQTIIKTAAELGWSGSTIFFLVQNAGMVEGAYKVTIGV